MWRSKLPCCQSFLSCQEIVESVEMKLCSGPLAAPTSEAGVNDGRAAACALMLAILAMATAALVLRPAFVGRGDKGARAVAPLGCCGDKWERSGPRGISPNQSNPPTPKSDPQANRIKRINNVPKQSAGPGQGHQISKIQAKYLNRKQQLGY